MARNNWVELVKPSNVSKRDEELKYSIESYSFPQLAERWSTEAAVPVEAVAKVLTRAILSGDLQPTHSDEVVLVTQGSDGIVHSLYLQEVVGTMVIAGAQRTPFNELDESERADRLNGYLTAVGADGKMEGAPALRLILIARDDFKVWVQSNEWRLPAFWFPQEGNTHDGTKNHPAHTKPARDARPKTEATKAMVASWCKRAEELENENPKLSRTDIAVQISANKNLNPKGRAVETIRKAIARR